MIKSKKKFSKSGFPYLPARLVPVKNKQGVADVSTRWYVVFYVFSEITEKLEKKRNYDVNKYPSVSERKAAAKSIIAEINNLLYDDFYIKKEALEFLYR